MHTHALYATDDDYRMELADKEFQFQKRQRRS